MDRKFFEAMEKLKITDSMNLTLKQEINSISEHNDELLNENKKLRRHIKRYQLKCDELNEENLRLVENFQKIEIELG